MKKYRITVTEHLARTLTIEADDPGDALEKAEAMINNSEVILDAEDFIDRDFECDFTSGTEGEDA